LKSEPFSHYAKKEYDMIARTWVGMGMGLLVAVALAGCSNESKPTASAPSEKPTETAGKHDGWWCVEHGIPEGICAQCSAKVAGEFKAKGDWCKEHNRPESQCFICHPELEATFAAQYEAKYGKKPPKPEGE
jgi:cobalt-zinc-cadmium efflux system membrane fusion protein